MSGIQTSRCKISPWCRKNNGIMSIFSYSKSVRDAVPLWKRINFGHRCGNPAAHLRHPPPAASTAKKIGAARGEFPHWRNTWTGSTNLTKYGMYKLVSMGVAVIHVCLNCCKDRTCLYVCTNPLQPCAKLPAGSCKLRSTYKWPKHAKLEWWNAAMAFAKSNMKQDQHLLAQTFKNWTNQCSGHLASFYRACLAGFSKPM